MEDFLGNTINVGDTVVACVGHGRNSGASLVKFVVTGLTPKMVKGDIPDYTGRVSKSAGQTRISADNCIVIQKGSTSHGSGTTFAYPLFDR